MNWLVIMPTLICITAIIMASFSWQALKIQKLIHVIASLVLLLTSILLFNKTWEAKILVMQLGNWPAPFGITFIADKLSASMVLITAIINLAVGTYALADTDKAHQYAGYFPLYWIVLLGICSSFLTGDLFNLYVWFEVMLIASFVLLGLGNEKPQLDGTFKYVVLNVIGTVILLTGIALLYGLTGTLNMADLAVHIAASHHTTLLITLALILTLAFGIKAALFPLYAWLPASYHTTSVATSALFAGLLTKVGVYTLIRLYTLIFSESMPYPHEVLLIVAGITMITGVLGAIIEYDFRRLLSFHIISQIGYIILGLAIGTPLALTACLFYLLHHMLVKTNLFLISGVTQHIDGSFNLLKLGSLYRYFPLLTILFFISAFSLAGVPPLSGFWAKLLIIKASLNAKHMILAFIALIVSLLTLYSMAKIWREAFWKHDPQAKTKPVINISKAKYIVLLIPITFLASLTLVISFWPAGMYNLTSATAAELLNSQVYIAAVMKNGGVRT